MNREIVMNTQKGLELLNKEIGNTNDNLKKAIQKTFNNMNAGIEKLKDDISHTSIEDKVKAAFPVATLSSMVTLMLYFLTTYLANKF